MAADEGGRGADGRPKRVQGGWARSDVVLSATVGGNAEVFLQVLALHVPLGARVADVTWGKGVFWQGVPEGAYEVLATDLQSGVDATDLLYEQLSPGPRTPSRNIVP